MHYIGVGIHETQREYFNAKIRDVVKQYSVIANNYVDKDRKQISSAIEIQKTKEEAYEEFQKFIDVLFNDIRGRK
jgi:nitrogen fixation/metabolism regulation signal transduction histidine kinase